MAFSDVEQWKSKYWIAWDIAPPPSSIQLQYPTGQCISASHLSSSGLHHPKELEYNYDIDLVLQELLTNRVILKPKYFCSKGLTDTNEGGASGKKRGDQVASINLMKSKWGKYFSYNMKTNVPHINVKR